MPPQLPQHAKDPDARASQLAAARERYRFDHSFMDYALAAEVPDEDEFDARYVAGAAEKIVATAANAATSKIGIRAIDGVEGFVDGIRGLLASRRSRELASEHTAAEAQVQERLRGDHPLPLEDYARMYPLLPDPASAQHWREDWYFAWQRIAGCNPLLIEGVTELPDHFPVTDAHLARSITGDSLDAARAEGRLFLVDHAMLDPVPCGVADGHHKRLYATMSLYLRTKAGELAPVAIQCGQTPGKYTPIHTPGDGIAWSMAKLAVQTADANFQAAVAHMGHCHLIVESALLSARRQLAADHPLLVLLTPHFEYTLPANEVMRNNLISPGGELDVLLSGTLEGTRDLVRRCMAAYPFCRVDAPTQFADRRVADTTALPDYPFRDDALASWGPLLEFVRAYVGLYYRAPADVAADHELRAWVREFGDPAVGGVHRVTERLETVDDVVMLIARLVYTCTVYHASINYSSYDFLGFPPNMPTACFAPAPQPGGELDERAMLAMMTPLDLSFKTFNLMYAITLRLNQFGEYPEDHFTDPRVAPLVERLQLGLAAAEAQIERRNQTRPAPYPYLLPSRVPASLHV